MKKLKPFHVGNFTVLNQQEMMNLSGGEATFTCRTNEKCNLYITNLGITVQGTCRYSVYGSSVSCYCKNGGYSSDADKTSSCWKNT